MRDFIKIVSEAGKEYTDMVKGEDASEEDKASKVLITLVFLLGLILLSVVVIFGVGALAKKYYKESSVVCLKEKVYEYDSVDIMDFEFRPMFGSAKSLVDFKDVEFSSKVYNDTLICRVFDRNFDIVCNVVKVIDYKWFYKGSRELLSFDVEKLNVKEVSGKLIYEDGSERVVNDEDIEDIYVEDGAVYIKAIGKVFKWCVLKEEGEND